MDRKTGIPLYLQLMDIITRDINNHVYRPGDQLPSEREFCSTYELSRITVRQALQELEREGYINKKHGKGTFVTKEIFQQNLINLYSFTDEMKRIGKKPSTKVTSFEIIPANDNIARRMKLTGHKQVIKAKRLRIADDEPLMYETSYLPRDVFINLTKEQLEKQAMYEIFQQDYHIGVTKAIEDFTATTMEKSEADFLHEEAGSPAILIKRYGYYNDQIIEYTTSIVSSLKFHYRVEISK
ncbi:GntR family transcriptional regulator [Sporolactobacillus shoreae]|uniref:GntR family transcriptional regulator n=1 Tax=Sporolactobacillus shoreae TaxID=1465501 RepID=A0A4Z0GP47_9BACL|nr:GntR family transcriptional regulator [Sporolactobacillus shoreae]